MFLFNSKLKILSYFSSTRLFSTSKAAGTWRTQIKQTQLVSQISNILLQRHNWASLLQTLNLSSKLNPPLFYQILIRIQSNPKISLSFFNWAKLNTQLQPDPKSLCQLIHISIQCNSPHQAKPILDTVVKIQPLPTELVKSAAIVCRGTNSPANVLSFMIESYSHKGLCLEGLKLVIESRLHRYVPTVSAYNALLGALHTKGESKLAWCVFNAMVRDGVSPDKFTWSIIAGILGKDGRYDRLQRLLELRIANSVIYNLVISGYCNKGEFQDAFNLLTEMRDRKLNPGFGTYTSILDSGCKYGDSEVIEVVLASMVDKKLLPDCNLSEYDSIIQKFSDSGKTNAAELFMRRAYDNKIELHDATYGCFLKALSKKGRVKEALQIYRTTLEKGIKVNESNCYAFADALCREDPSEEVTEVLGDMIKRGFSPDASSLSKFISFQCDKRRWREAEDLLNLMMDKRILPDSACCCSLVKHYCHCRHLDSAITLHDKMEKLKGGLDEKTYELFIKVLFMAGRAEEAVKLFNYMRTENLLSSGSFVAMIRGLCRAKELRQAMKLHDEMLGLELKPDKGAYRRLISGFS